ncbi:efflux pump antibiotic resistance protein, putative [Talaromyces stipitatus ATCC 10500]|uniref:Efflux pump antibiotic resistance protein, putative n=1 Tax=Talaromyces stipitatus (strain ATCC 10500 / CBS 375.48 / QM 6759 / NRRL 1006) TaxID=441959 RepID=B8M583_TALSN|nr:efflux pump antibiotic resistance protein, putative [Talaromyces stipitatus ATCC 10500]EED19689.1 efflux pump antibiotic resistance protein, putative [Talaromyces stipitatus ATCC 10500]
MAGKQDHQELALLGTNTPIHEKPTEESTDTSKDVLDDHEYPELLSLMAIMTALYLAIFLVALDRTIIATAIPRITDDFHALDDIAWYGSAYLLTSCSFQLLYGRIYTFYSPKWVFLCAIILFEIGSAVCGGAPTSTAFIVGRAIAGLGSCGIFSGCIVIITDAVPLQKRPMLTGLMGSLFGIASVVAPLIGGAFTEKVTWRWCFYINLPIGALTILVILFILKASPPPNPSPAHTLKERLHQLDPFGTGTFLPGMICLLLALTWGGVTYPWNNGRIIALFVLSGVLLIAFVLIQVWEGETASVPPRLVKKRTMSAGFFFTFCVGGTMLLVVYYLPVWFQAIKGANAVKSGIMNIPLVLSLVVGTILAGAAVTNIGYFTPFMIAGSVVMAIGAGLLTTFTTNTGHSKWIGYQVIFGLGIGIGMQQGSVAAQTILERKDVPTGASIMMLAQSLGGSIFLAVGQTVFSNGLSSHLQSYVQGPEAANIISMVTQAGATGFRRLSGLSPEDLSAILSAYNKAIVDTFYVCVGLASVSIIGSLATEWVSVKKQGDNKEPAEKKGQEVS